MWIWMISTEKDLSMNRNKQIIIRLSVLTWQQSLYVNPRLIALLALYWIAATVLVAHNPFLGQPTRVESKWNPAVAVEPMVVRLWHIPACLLYSLVGSNTSSSKHIQKWWVHDGIWCSRYIHLFISNKMINSDNVGNIKPSSSSISETIYQGIRATWSIAAKKHHQWSRCLKACDAIDGGMATSLAISILSTNRAVRSVMKHNYCPRMIYNNIYICVCVIGICCLSIYQPYSIK